MTLPAQLTYDVGAALTHLRAADPVLGGVIARVGPCRLQLQPARSLFAALLRSIIYQQLHGRAAAAIHARVRALLRPHGGVSATALGRVRDEDLQAAGLSRAKLAALRDLAARCADRTVPSLARAAQLEDEALLSRLTAVRGVGPWTVHMLLLFTLGRPDVLPTGDFAIRQAFTRLYRRRGAASPAALIRQAERWRPYRSVASWYLWRSLDTA